MLKQLKGFSWIGALAIIGLFGILFAIALILINPAHQISQLNNAKRQSDVVLILGLIRQYASDHRGTLPVGIPLADTTKPLNGAAEISKTGVDICTLLVPTYSSFIPVDPILNNGVSITDCKSSYVTGYDIVKDAKGKVTVTAPDEEIISGQSTGISATK